MCYGKPEAGALFFVTPLLLLGHLSGYEPRPGCLLHALVAPHALQSRFDELPTG